MTGPELFLPSSLKTAALALIETDKAPSANDLLGYLGYDDADAAAGARMLRAAARFRRLFRLPMPDAPGLSFFGAEAHPVCVGAHNAGLAVSGFAGSGLTPRQAFEACVGEGVEYLSQFVQPDDPVQSATIDALELDPELYGFVRAVLGACGIPADRAIDWVPVRRLSDGARRWYPADLCLRRAGADFVAPLKLSTGCAAGATREAATQHAMLELIERDAVALWWRGGRRGRTIVPESEAGIAATALLLQLRQTQGGRQTSLLDITTDVGIPVVVAFSLRQDGGGFALGFGARMSLAEAARSAIFEMCQAELSLHVIAAKRRQSGEAALNESDRRQLERAKLHPDTCPLLLPRDDGAAVSVVEGDAIEVVARRGIVAYSIDLTRPIFGVPVVRVIAPGLQLEPCEIIGDRLARAIAETGGAAKHSGGIALM